MFQNHMESPLSLVFYSHKDDDNDDDDDGINNHHSLWNKVKLLCQVLHLQFLFNFHLTAMLYLLVVSFCRWENRVREWFISYHKHRESQVTELVFGLVSKILFQKFLYLENKKENQTKTKQQINTQFPVGRTDRYQDNSARIIVLGGTFHRVLGKRWLGWKGQ